MKKAVVEDFNCDKPSRSCSDSNFQNASSAFMTLLCSYPSMYVTRSLGARLIDGQGRPIPPAIWLRDLKEQLNSPNYYEAGLVLYNLSKYVDSPECSLKAVEESGLIAAIVKLMRSNRFVQLRYEAAETLLKLIIHPDIRWITLIENTHGAVIGFVELLSSSEEALVEKGALALDKLIDNTPSITETLVSQLNLFRAMMGAYAAGRLDLNLFCRLVGSVCVHDTLGPIDSIRPLMPVIVRCLDLEVQDGLPCAVSAVLRMCSWGMEFMEELVAHGAVQKLVNLLENRDVQDCTIIALSDLAGHMRQVCSGLVVRSAGVSKLARVLPYTTDRVRTFSLHILGSIVFDSRANIQKVIDAAIVPELIHILQSDPVPDKAEALSILHNMTAKGTLNQALYLIKCRILRPVCEFLVSNPEYALHSLATIQNIFMHMDVLQLRGDLAGAATGDIPLGALYKVTGRLTQDKNPEVSQLAQKFHGFFGSLLYEASNKGFPRHLGK